MNEKLKEENNKIKDEILNSNPDKEKIVSKIKNLPK